MSELEQPAGSLRNTLPDGEYIVRFVPAGRQYHAVKTADGWKYAEWPEPFGHEIVEAVAAEEEIGEQVRSKPLRPWFKTPDRDGDRSVKSQVKGLGAVDFKGKTVLDLGCAEGAISLHTLDCGATAAHGVEQHEEYIEAAYTVCRGRNACFWPMDLAEFHTKHPTSGLLPRYDVILLLSIIHKLADPLQLLDYCATLSDTLVIRLPDRVLADPRSAPLEVDIQEHLSDCFELVTEPKTCIEPVTGKREWMGVFQRRGTI